MNAYWTSVSPAESAFLGYLTGEGKQWFSIEDAYAAFPDKSEGAVRFMLMRMLRKGLLIKVSKKAYWVVPFDQDAGEFLPDWHLLAEPLSGGGRYYIGYYSALQIHGLITQPSLKEQVVREKHKTETVVLKGVEFLFVHRIQRFPCCHGRQVNWKDLALLAKISSGKMAKETDIDLSYN